MLDIMRVLSLHPPTSPTKAIAACASCQPARPCSSSSQAVKGGGGTTVTAARCNIRRQHVVPHRVLCFDFFFLCSFFVLRRTCPLLPVPVEASFAHEAGQDDIAMQPQRATEMWRHPSA